MLTGEIIALFVSLSFTATALFADVGSRRMGSLPFNAVRMMMSLAMLALTLWLTMGIPWPRYADSGTWMWLLLSGLVGYVFGDWCLMQGYILIGSRFGQLFMTLSAPTAALLGRLLLGEQMSAHAIVGMVVTLSGIGMSVLSKQGNENDDENENEERRTKNGKLGLTLPPKGVAIACGAGICQGAGLVLSKIGMEHYNASLASNGFFDSTVPPEALLPLPLEFSVPFASTMIRGLMGLTGFLLLMALSKEGLSRLRRAMGDKKGVRCAFASMLFGPFIGVSLSLMATLYTSTGVAQTLFALTPVLIIAPAAWLFHQKVTVREVIGAVVSVVGASLFFF